MDDLQFHIVPSTVPLGRTTPARLVVSYAGKQGLENLRGQVKLPASFSLLGLDEIHLPRVPAGRELSLPVRITGRQAGPVRIHLSRLTARSAAGPVLRFEDREIVLEVLPTIELVPGDVSLFVDPVGPLVQHRIGRVRCRLRNNFILPLDAPQITVSAGDAECYLGRNPAPPQAVPPGSFHEIEAQVLPGKAGVLRLSARAEFSIHNQAFAWQEDHSLDVRPSQEAPASVPTRELNATRKILLVSAAPRDEAVLRSDKEMRDILFELNHSAPLRESFQVNVLLAASMDDLSREIIYQPPYLVHFCGHGSERGIVLEDANGEAKVMPTAALIGLLRPFSGQVECVILNACETLYSARELAPCIPYVIGMRQAILDPAAIAFSRGFYQALGAGHSIERSFELGKARLLQDYFTENMNPVLYKHGRAV